MERKIKLLWDFRGPAAQKTAEHHKVHLVEFTHREKIPAESSGVEQFAPGAFSAFIVVPESHMLTVRDALKPGRATVFSGSDQE